MYGTTAVRVSSKIKLYQDLHSLFTNSRTKNWGKLSGLTNVTALLTGWLASLVRPTDSVTVKPIIYYNLLF